ncbi:MAG: helix-turn-helix domain-containing protein [Anaerolineae bacterium]|jgi:AraC family transcriptional regulator|nr:helix-turn-helix domain-containing protein [Anaerolineae bacterium]
MTDLTPIIKAVDFIEGNLKQEIAVADIADAAAFSLYHFCRVFSQTLHLTPYDYLIRRRLSESAVELADTDRKIIDVAFDYQFNNHETYTRAFKRMFGMQPYQWRKRPAYQTLMPEATAAYIRHINKGPYLKPVLEERGPLCLVGLTTMITDDAAVVPQLWEIVEDEFEEVPTPQRYGLLWAAAHSQDQVMTRFYMAAVEAAPTDPLAPDLLAKTLPAASYARFIHKGPYGDLRLSQDYVHHTWLPKSGQQLANTLLLQVYPQGFDSACRPDSETLLYFPLASPPLPPSPRIGEGGGG